MVAAGVIQALRALCCALRMAGGHAMGSSDLGGSECVGSCKLTNTARCAHHPDLGRGHLLDAIALSIGRALCTDVPQSGMTAEWRDTWAYPRAGAFHLLP